MMTKEKLGKYQIEEKIGSGAYADVYRATDTALKRVVALKILKPMLLADEEAFARFIQEAQTLANLVHPHIAWVWDLGEVDGHYFISMRYIDGLSLGQVLEERGPLTWKETLAISKQISKALQFAHDKGLVHRDVKPGNILISENEGAILTDFGLVKAMQSSGMSTRTGAIIGTPQYIPPEVWKGKSSTSASDQYALACILIEMLTGETLFQAPTPPAIMLKHFEPVELPADWQDGVPEGIERVIEKALAQKPGERYGKISLFIETIESLVAELENESLTQEQAEKTKQEKQETQQQTEQVLSQEPGDNFEDMSTSVKHLNVQPSNVQTAHDQPVKDRVKVDGDEMTFTLAPGVELTLVRVPAGTFLMGSSEDDRGAHSAEKPQHKVHLDEYWIGKYPVTNSQYKTFVDATGHKEPSHFENGEIPKGKADHPVVNVSWHDARAFCKWASQVTGAEIRLSNEAEWEKAARGTDGRKYPWGDQKPDVGLCNFNDNIGDTTRGGRYSPGGDSPYGCADMAGNVWEWMSSLYKDYPYRAGDGRENTVAGDDVNRVLRGGSWDDGGDDVRVADRFRYHADFADFSFGFRCASKAKR